MTTTVTNKTRRPLRVVLGRGKTMYLGPGKSGEITPADAEHPSVKTLVEKGEIAIAQGRSNGPHERPFRAGDR